MLFASLKGYRAAQLPADALAGVLLAALSIPAMIATARLAGMPPDTGLVAFVAGTLVFAVFGVNRFLSVGADSTIAPIFAATIAGFAVTGSPEYALYVGFVSLLVGLLLVALGILRAGWVSDLLSIPVTIGILAGIAVQITVSQAPAMLGIGVAPAPLPQRIAEIVGALPHANVVALTLGAGVLAVIFVLKKIGERLPGTLVALLLAGVAVAVLHLERRVAIVGALRVHAPALRVPMPPSGHLLQVFTLAVVVSVVCTVQTVTTLRTFRSAKGLVDPSRDLAAVGAGSIVAALAGSFAVDASPPRTAVAQSSGASSQLAGLVAAAVTVLYALFGQRLTQWVPESALAAVLIFIAVEIFRYQEMRRIAHESKLEIGLVVVAAALVIALPINVGMVLSILLSLLTGVYVMARPPSVELVHVPGTSIWWPPSKDESTGEREPGLVVFAPAAPIYFMNVRRIVQRLDEAVEAAANVKLFVLECSGVIDIDYTGAHVLKVALKRLRDEGVRVAVARLSEERAVESATRSGLLAAIGTDRVFKSVQDAVDSDAGTREEDVATT